LGVIGQIPFEFQLFRVAASSEEMIRENNAKLNMSTRMVIFTSGQNVKPPFLCQSSIFFNGFFFTLEI